MLIWIFFLLEQQICIQDKQLVEGEVDFGNSDTRKPGCKEYRITENIRNKTTVIRVKNCDSTATIISLEME